MKRQYMVTNRWSAPEWLIIDENILWTKLWFKIKRVAGIWNKKTCSDCITTNASNIISFNHSCVCRIELSNQSCLTLVCKRGSADTEATRVRKFATAYTGWLKLFLTHLFHLMYFNYRTYIALCCSQYYRVNMARITFTILTI